MVRLEWNLQAAGVLRVGGTGSGTELMLGGPPITPCQGATGYVGPRRFRKTLPMPACSIESPVAEDGLASLRDAGPATPSRGTWDTLGFLQDFFQASFRRPS